MIIHSFPQKINVGECTLIYLNTSRTLHFPPTCFITNNYEFFTYQNFIDTGIKYFNKEIYDYTIEIFTNAESVAVKDYEKIAANNWIKNVQQKMK